MINIWYLERMDNFVIGIAAVTENYIKYKILPPKLFFSDKRRKKKHIKN